MKILSLSLLLLLISSNVFATLTDSEMDNAITLIEVIEKSQEQKNELKILLKRANQEQIKTLMDYKLNLFSNLSDYRAALSRETLENINYEMLYAKKFSQESESVKKAKKLNTISNMLDYLKNASEKKWDDISQENLDISKKTFQISPDEIKSLFDKDVIKELEVHKKNNLYYYLEKDSKVIQEYLDSDISPTLREMWTDVENFRRTAHNLDLLEGPGFKDIRCNKNLENTIFRFFLN
jgi:hypothetical protein